MNYLTKEIEIALKQLAKTLSKKIDITIEFINGPGESWTDGKSIFIFYGTNNNPSIILGVLCHEIAHVLYSYNNATELKAIFDNEKNNKLYLDVVNTVEDILAEKELNQKFKGTRKLIDNAIIKIYESNPPTRQGDVDLLTLLYLHYTGMPSAFGLNGDSQHMLQSLVTDMGYYLDGAWSKTKLISILYDILNDHYKGHKQKSTQMVPILKQIKNVSQSKKVFISHDIHNLKEQVVHTYPNDSDPDLYKKILNYNKKYIDTTVQILNDAYKTREKYIHASYGRKIDRKQLYKFNTNNVDIFKKEKLYKQPKDIEVTLLIDNSASMGRGPYTRRGEIINYENDPLTAASFGMVILHESLKSIRIRHNIVGFRSTGSSPDNIEHIVYKTGGGNFYLGPYGMNQLLAGKNSNYDGESIAHIYKKIQHNANSYDYHIIIVVGDGSFCGGPTEYQILKETIQNINKDPNADIFAVGLSPITHPEELYKNFLIINDLSGFRYHFTNYLQEILVNSII